MPDFFLPRALLPTGWASRVLVSSDTDGKITRIQAETKPAGESLTGVSVPGIPNLHSHAFQRAMAGLTEARSPGGRDSFWSWRERMYAFLARLGPDDVEAIASQLYVEMLEAGYTSLVEFHYLHHDPSGRPYQDPAEMSRRLLAAAERTGLGFTLCPSIYMTGDFGGAPPNEGQRRFLVDPDAAAELVESLGADLRSGRLSTFRRLGLAPHSLRAVPPEALNHAVSLAGHMGPETPIHIHVSEQRREVEACLAWSGARPVEWLLDHAPVDGRWCLIHATHVTKDELAGIARSGALAGLCPTTEGNLGDGRFPLRGHLENGGAFGIGTDSHVSVSPAEELRWLEYGQRLTSEARNVAAGFPHASTGRTLFELACAGGARAAAIPAGRLEVGAYADWIVLDPEHPTLTGRQDDALLDSWIFSGNTSPVRHVVVGGRVVVRDGRHPLREEVLERYRRTMRRILE